MGYADIESLDRGPNSENLLIIDEIMANFNIKSFSSKSKIVVNGSAKLESGLLRLTDKTDGQAAGSAFYSKPINFKSDTSFETSFQFQIDDFPWGFVFMVQNDPRKDGSIGNFQTGLGYGGISKSVAVEFDTFADNSSDPDSNHIGVNQNGSIESIKTVPAFFDIDNGEVVYAWVDYNGKNDKLDVFLSNRPSKSKNPLLSTKIDIPSVVGKKAYVGFSAGGSSDNQDVLQWKFSSSDKQTNQPSKGINGDNKNNRLQGTNKGDLIDGKNGNDTLIGAGGNDTLTGGGGADDFLLGSGKVYKKKDLGIDTITDFQPNVDDIILDTDTFGTLKSKAGEGFSIGREFESVKNKRGVAGSKADIVYDRATGDLYYNANGPLGGFGGGGKIATLEGAPRISASDFVLE